jgi:heme exporter protein B
MVIASRLWWLVHKDLVVESRARQAWPTMLFLGTIVAMACGLQLDLPAAERQVAAAALLWLSVLFAGLVTIDRTFAVEREDGCWDGLILYPISPAVLFLAKLLVNFIALTSLQCVLIPLFAVTADLPLLKHFWAIGAIGLLSSLGLAAVGTLVGAMTHGARQRNSVLSLLILPLVVPLVVACTEATRLIAAEDLGAAWWRWVQLLSAFAFVYTLLGAALFGCLIED